jgi:antimicrobial peptide system SdpB family protein
VSPLNNVYGIGRSLLAFSTLLTLISNTTDTLFMRSSELIKVNMSAVVNASLFNILDNHLIIAHVIAIVILLVVIGGFFPRYTGVFHWYVSFSFFASCSIIDGGDQANAVLTLLLVPITLLDGRKSHWYNSVIKQTTGATLNILSWTFLFIIRIQVSMIYLHAGVAKLQVPEWINGTATYYWLTHYYHGASEWLKPFVLFLTSNNLIVVILSWGVMLLEFLLFAALMLDPNSLRRKILLLVGIFFHLSIAVVHGLISFYVTMVAALILYLSNYERPYIIPNVNINRLKKKWTYYS